VNRALGRPRADAWYRTVENRAADSTEVWIFDEIGPWYAVTARDFVRDLQEITTRHISLHLHSPGGEVFDSIAIYRALLQHPARVEVLVDSLAASSASVIAMAGDRIVMSRHAQMMVHLPFGIVVGDAGDMRAVAAQLDGLGEEIASIYAERAGGSVRDWLQRMGTETWYRDQEAVDIGLADAVGPPATRALDQFDLSRFTHRPKEDAMPVPTIRDAEGALRDAGFSRSHARAILAQGWDARDAREPMPPEPPEPPVPDPEPEPVPTPSHGFRARLEADLVELAVR
jgi:ATP-dependent protease ClpP protease subunit